MVCKTMHVSSVQLSKTSSAHCTTVLCTHLPRQSLFQSPFPPALPWPTSIYPLSLWPSSNYCLCRCVVNICALADPFTFSDPVPHPPLRQLSVCSMYPCLCFYVVPQIILFFRFRIQVRSYGIYLFMSSLFHLA